MPRLIALSTGLLALLLFSFGAAAQSAPTPPPDTSGDDDATALAKKLQNPIGDLYSFPFQNNTNFNTGPNKGTQDILNVQPVIPIHINPDGTVITSTILPLVWQPSFQPAQTVPFGTGPTTFSAFLSVANPVNGWLWGVGRGADSDDQQREPRFWRADNRDPGGRTSCRERPRTRARGIAAIARRSGVA
jgi:hypothetical protein